MTAHDETLSTQNERLERLRVGTDKLGSLRQRECELEVELIAAEAALRAESRKSGLTLEPAQAAELTAALKHTRQLQGMQEKLQQRAAQGNGNLSRKLARLGAGRDALLSWLQAPQAGRAPRLSPAVRGLLATATLVCVWAAMLVHPVVLVLLVPLLLPLAWIRWSRQNAAWLQLGAKRHYQVTGLEPPAAWQALAVSERMSELERSIEALSAQPEQPADDADLEQHEAELAQSQALLETLLIETGLDVSDIDGDTERWLGLATQTHSARKALDEVKTQRARLRAETDEDREALFRFLSRHGEAPADGHADPQTLAAGLARIAHRS